MLLILKIISGNFLSIIKMGSSPFWDARHSFAIFLTFQDNMSPHFQESSRPFKMESIYCPETSINNCQLMLRNIEEERRPEPHRGGSLEARIIWLIFVMGKKCSNLEMDYETLNTSNIDLVVGSTANSNCVQPCAVCSSWILSMHKYILCCLTAGRNR